MRKLFILLPVFLMAATVEPTRIAVGDPIIVRTSENISFSKPFSLLSLSKSEGIYQYAITLYEPGKYELNLENKKYSIEVISLLKGGDELKEIVPPLSIKGNPFWIAKRLLGFLSLLLIAFLVYKIIKSSRRTVVISPEEEIEKYLIESRNAFSEGDMDSFYSILSFSLRNYIQRKFSIPALSLTSSELKEKGEEKIASVLKRADLVRFAGEAINMENSRKDLSWAFNYLEERKIEISKA